MKFWSSDAYFHPILSPIMIKIEFELLTEYIKLKPPLFQGTENKDAF